VGPFVKFRITEAGIFLRQARRAGPAACVHPTAAAKPLKDVKDGVGFVDGWAPDNIIPARKGALVGVCLPRAKLTESAPAD
jgi:hypothetical protein